MKKIGILLLALAFSFASSVSVYATEPTDSTEPAKMISKQIGKLLEDPHFPIEKDEVAEVRFMLNDKNEIVVLTVDSTNNQVERFIKARLNYIKLGVQLEEKSKEYKVTVKLEADFS